MSGHIGTITTSLNAIVDAEELILDGSSEILASERQSLVTEWWENPNFTQDGDNLKTVAAQTPGLYIYVHIGPVEA